MQIIVRVLYKKNNDSHSKVHECGVVFRMKVLTKIIV